MWKAELPVADVPRTPPGRATDAALVERVRRGERDAFEPLMRRYNRRLFRAARGVCRSDAEAEDAVQDAWVRAYTRLHEFRGPAGLGTWLARIAVNEARMRRRGAPAGIVHEPFDESRDDADGMEAASPTPEEATANAQLGGLVERCLDRLPTAYRSAFLLRVVEQLSVAETAAALDIPEATVKTRVQRGRRLLRRSVSNEIRGALDQAFPFAGHRCDRMVAAVLRRLAGRAPGAAPGPRNH
jgi:RNA polymerase sigma-70 factor (ECF subfamily)